jgi:hypothetical protein
MSESRASRKPLLTLAKGLAAHERLKFGLFKQVLPAGWRKKFQVYKMARLFKGNTG